MKKILITGSAGFIGFHLVNHLLKSSSFEITGLDNINDYYDVNLKFARLKEHGIDRSNILENKLIISETYILYNFIKADLEDYDFILDFMKAQKFDIVINLAAQAGVRYSLQNPRAYLRSNIDGFLSVLDGCRYSNVKHLLYASTSSVYGLNTNMPLSENQSTEHPISLYSATKKANELMAHTYSHLFNLPTSGLRFFTVYGPWGRPDMALFLFAKGIINNEKINVFNHGKMVRDFTYVSDVVESIIKLIEKIPSKKRDWNSNIPELASSSAPYQVYNIGNNTPVNLIDYIQAIELALGKKAEINYLEMQPGDVPETRASVTKLEKMILYKPNTTVIEGVSLFIKWFKEFYNHK